jgi:cell volume regulation protein A
VATILLTLGLVYFFAHFLSNTFDRSRIPDVLVLMLFGILVGPVLDWTSPAAFGQVGTVLTTVALAVILFESGTTLDLGAIRHSARSTVQVTLLTAFVTIAVVGAIGTFVLRLPWLSALLLGAIVSGTSSSVVVPMVRVLKMRERAATVLILESAITDVTSIVFAFALLDASVQGRMYVGVTIGQTLASLVFASMIGVGGGIGWLLVWERVRSFPTTIFTTLASAFVLYGFAEFLGFAGPIAVLAYGITLSNHEYFGLARWFKGRPVAGITAIESDFYKEVVFLLKTFFFVYLGISMRFDDWSLIAAAVAIMLTLHILRLYLTPTMLPPTIGRKDASIVAVMIPKGLAAAVLAGLPLEARVEGGATIQSATYAIVLVSIALSAIAVGAHDRQPLKAVFDRSLRAFPEEPPPEPPRPTPRGGTRPVPGPSPREPG